MSDISMEDPQVLEQLTPEEQDSVFLGEDRVLGSAYLKSKRRGLRRRGMPVRRTMWEPEAPKNPRF